jgi:pimeloyl-ACP methyl ester carboxylesterase
VHADDAAALLSAVSEEPAYVYGNSGGGTIGLDLVARHPGLVRTLVAHETFLIEVLPDSAKWRSRLDDLSETYRTEGVFAAMGKFGAMVEEGGPSTAKRCSRRRRRPRPRR